MSINPSTSNHDLSTLRDRREHFNIELRKKRTDEILNARRQKFMALHPNPIKFNSSEAYQILNTRIMDFMQSITCERPNFGAIEEKLELLRYMISEHEVMNPYYVRLIIDNGCLTPLINLLSPTHQGLPSIQQKAVWILANLFGVNDQSLCQIIKVSGAVPLLVDMLYSKDPELVELALMALAGAVCEDPQMRDYLVERKIEVTLLDMLNTQKNTQTEDQEQFLGILENMMYFIRFFVENKHPKDWNYYEPFLKWACDGILYDEASYTEDSLNILNQLVKLRPSEHLYLLFEIPHVIQRLVELC
jgi:hypothetical protein